MRIILILFLIFNISFAKCMENNPQERADPFNVESSRVFVELNRTYKCNYDKIENDSLEEVNPFHLKDPAVNYYSAFHKLNGTNKFNFYKMLRILSKRDKEAFHNDILYEHYPKEITNIYYQYRLSSYRKIVMDELYQPDYCIEGNISYLRKFIIRYWLLTPPIYLNKEDFLSIIYTAEQRKYRFLLPYLPLQELIFLNFIRLKPQEKINNYETINLPNQSGFTVSQDDIYNVWEDVRHVPMHYCSLSDSVYRNKDCCKLVGNGLLASLAFSFLRIVKRL